MVFLTNESLSIHIWVYFSEHITPVSCVASGRSGTLVISGGHDSQILVTRLEDGNVFGKLDHHRGIITSLCVDYNGDVLVAGKSRCN